MEEQPFRISLKLKEGKSPHIYLTQLKAMMENDTSLHPMMHKTLIMLKKTRTPFIMIPSLKEVVIDGLNFRHFDRSANPRGDWVAMLWSEDEIKQHKNNPNEHVEAILHFFEALGYEVFNMQFCSGDYVKSLEALTIEQINSEKERIEEENKNGI